MSRSGTKATWNQLPTRSAFLITRCKRGRVLGSSRPGDGIAVSVCVCGNSDSSKSDSRYSLYTPPRSFLLLLFVCRASYSSLFSRNTDWTGNIVAYRGVHFVCHQVIEQDRSTLEWIRTWQMAALSDRDNSSNRMQCCVELLSITLILSRSLFLCWFSSPVWEDANIFWVNYNLTPTVLYTPFDKWWTVTGFGVDNPLFSLSLFLSGAPFHFSSFYFIQS